MAEGEERPLLGKGDDSDDTVDKQQEFFDLTSMALQVSLATFTRIALTSIDSAFLGHLGTQELAAASLAQVWTSVPLMGVVCATRPSVKLASTFEPFFAIVNWQFGSDCGLFGADFDFRPSDAVMLLMIKIRVFSLTVGLHELAHYFVRAGMGCWEQGADRYRRNLAHTRLTFPPHLSHSRS
jgi:hypothetical protein